MHPTDPEPAGDPPALRRPDGPAATVAGDEAYWARVAAHYPLTDAVTNLEGGYYGLLATPVLREFHRQTDRCNREWTRYTRGTYEDDLRAVRSRVARFLGCEPDEIAFTRNATEALHGLITQYTRLAPGDEVLYADLDYHAMRYAVEGLAARRGVTPVKITIPEPATREQLLQAYADALALHPRVRLVLLTHLNNLTGLVIPVREIAAMARDRGADAIVDAAHSFGQVELTLPDLGADFVGLNLHKWLGAPIGAAVMYVRRGRAVDLDSVMVPRDNPGTSIDAKVHTGTVNFATMLTIPAALDFHEAVGPAFKAARVRWLRDRWVRAARAIPGVEVTTSDAPGTVAAISSLRLHGRGSREANQALAHELLERHRILTVWREGPARGDVVRVTPGLHNKPADCDRLVEALQRIAARG